MKAGASTGRIPAKVSVKDRAIVIAGFAKDVDAVNQYAEPIQQATIHGASSARRWPMTTSSSPQVATASETHWAGPLRIWVEVSNKGSSNIRCASRVPMQQPATWIRAYA